MKKLVALLTAALMVVLLVVPAMAAYNPGNNSFDYATNGTEVSGSTTKLTKYLVVDKDTESPKITFSYTLSAGSAVSATTGTPAVTEAWIYDGTPYATEAEAQAAADAAGAADYSGITHRAAADATDSTLPVLAGIGSPTVANVEFAKGAATTEGGSVSGDIITDTTKLYAKNDIVLDFSSVTFPAPGVYRYILTENNSNTENVGGVVYDVDAPGGTAQSRVRTIDVYVQDNGTTVTNSETWSYDGTEYDTQADANAAAKATIDSTTTPGKYIFNGTEYDTEAEAEAAAEAAVTHNAAPGDGSTLEILGYVAYDGNIADAPAQQYDPNGYSGPYANGDSAGTGIDTKKNYYINQIKTNTMTVKKVISGNQGNKESTWSIKVDFADMGGVNAKYAKIEANGVAVDNPTYADYTSGTELTYGHNDKYKFIGIPEGASYTVAETDANKEGYSTNYTGQAYTFTSDGNIEDKDDAVVTNTRQGVIPTGVAMGVIGGVVIVLIAAGYFVVRRKLATR